MFLALLFAFAVPAAANAPVTLVFTTVSLPDVSYTKVLYDVVKPELEKLTDGEMTLEIHDSSSLFSQDDELPATIRGNVDMCYTDATWLADYMPSMNMLTAGYMFKSHEHMSKVLNGEIGRAVFDRAASEIGVRPLFAYYIGARAVIMREDKKIYTPDDLKGVKLRMPNSEAWLFLGQSLGANPVPVAFSELYTALQTGTVDGLENPLGGIEEGKFYEVTKSISLTNHMIGAVWPCINEKKWKSLSPEHQDAVLKAFKAGLDANDEIAVGEEQGLLDKYKEMGMTVVTPDVDAFKKKVDAAYLGDPEKTKTWDMDLYKKILAMGE
jgi:tripartite ATP-independent transporter DctP family solute receptor